MHLIIQASPYAIFLFLFIVTRVLCTRSFPLSPFHLLFTDGILFLGNLITEQQLFAQCSSLVYAVSAQEDDCEAALPRLVDTISRAHSVNPNIRLEVRQRQGMAARGGRVLRLYMLPVVVFVFIGLGAMLFTIGV